MKGGVEVLYIGKKSTGSVEYVIDQKKVNRVIHTPYSYSYSHSKEKPSTEPSNLTSISGCGGHRFLFFLYKISFIILSRPKLNQFFYFIYTYIIYAIQNISLTCTKITSFFRSLLSF